MQQMTEEELEKFIEKHQDKVDWNYISQNQKLNEEFIEKHQDKVYWDCISRRQRLSEEFIQKHQDKVDWYWISYNQKLSEKFIEKHKDKVYWDCISREQRLSEKFIEKHEYKVNWFWISSNQKLSEEFIEKHQDKVNWVRISKSQKLSEEFIEKHQDKVISEARRNLELFREIAKEEAVRRAKSYAKEYGLKVDDEYLFCYRIHDQWNRGQHSKTVSYDEIGVEYRDWHCDPDPERVNSYGLGVFPKGNTKIKVRLEDFVLHVPGSTKGRVWAFTIIEMN